MRFESYLLQLLPFSAEDAVTKKPRGPRLFRRWAVSLAVLGLQSAFLQDIRTLSTTQDATFLKVVDGIRQLQALHAGTERTAA